MTPWNKWLARLHHAYDPIAVFLSLVIMLSIAYSAWTWSSEQMRAEARIRFDSRTARINEAIQGRMLDYEQVLRGAAGQFAASERVERSEWRAYIQSLRLEKIYPGIQAVGFALHVAPQALQSHIRSVRAEGYPLYEVRPGGERGGYAPIVFLEPFAGRNLRAFGYDLYADPVSRTAMEVARDSGSAALSGKITLVQETDSDVQPGILMFIPIYRNGLETNTVAERRRALTGYVSAAFRMNDLMARIIEDEPGVRVRAFDGRNEAPEHLLYDGLRDQDGRRTPLFTSVARSTVNNQVWTLHFSSTPQFETSIRTLEPRIILSTGIAISLLITAIIWLLLTQRRRAIALARQMTTELRESREQLGLALEGSNLALFDWNVESGEVLLGEQWARIIDREPAPTRTTIEDLQALVHPDDVDTVKGKVESLLLGHSAYYESEHRVRMRTGGWKWISSRVKVAERDARGRALRVAGTNADVTERKEIERLKNEFIATVSHELRTPLTAIVLSLGLLKELVAGKLPGEAATFLGMAQTNSERLVALVNDILDIEKVESGQVEFQAAPVAIGPLLERAAQLNRPYADKFGVRLDLSPPPLEVRVTGDADRLLQVLTNLISNAAKFSPAGTAVTLSAAVRNGTVRVAVADCGPGVPEEFRGRIFEKFAQADSSDTRHKGGTGLGLAISKVLIEKMGGKLGYDSSPGQGAVFYFDLPARR